VLLLALTNKLFEKIPIKKIQAAEAALLNGSNEFAADLIKRIYADKEMSKEDKEAILQIAGKLLTPFQDKPAPDKNKK